MPTAYIPTRFLSLSNVDDGALILFNSLTGALGAVPADQASIVRDALKRSARHIPPLTGLLHDLEEGGFLITEGTDERAIAHQKYLTRYRDEQLHLIILPTEQCNFRCTYCYESFIRGEMPQSIRDGIKRFVANQSNLKVLNIAWFGGEPLVAKNVVLELSRFFHQHCAERGIKLNAGATTNAYFLTPDLVDQLLPLGLQQFQITLDGVKEEHDQRRVLQGGGGTFDTILQNLRYMKSTNHLFSVVIRHNYDPQNASRLEEFINMLKNEFGGDPRFSTFFFPIGHLGGGNDSELEICDGKTSIDAFTRGKLLALEAGFRNALQIERMRPNGFTCYAANPRSFVIGSDGNLYKCTVELDYHDRNIVGRLHEDGSMSLDWRKMALWCETNGMEEGKKCYTCFFSPACHGAACPKEWMDEQECACPPEKLSIRKTLPLIYMESTRTKQSSIEPMAECMK